MDNPGALVNNIVSLGILGSVLYRQLQTRAIEAGSLWLRPGLFIGLAIALAAASISLAPARLQILAVCVLVGIVAGIATGTIVTRLTLPRSSVRFEELTVPGSYAAAGVWLVVFIAGFLARAKFGSILPIVYLDVNVATTATLATALSVIAFSYDRAIRSQSRPVAS